MIRIGSIQSRLLILIIAVLFVLGLIVTIFTYSNQKQNVIQATNRATDLNINTLITALRNLMLNGEAPIMVQTVRTLKEFRQYKEIDIFRRDGTPAFSDYKTLDFVNDNQFLYSFPRSERIVVTDELRAKLDGYKGVVAEAVASKTAKIIPDVRDMSIDYFYPVENLKDCMVCHGSDHTIRGVVHFKVSIAELYVQLKHTRNLLVVFFIIIGVALAVAIHYVFRSLVLSPLETIGDGVDRVGEGDFGDPIRLRRRDELGLLAEQINGMAKGLAERIRLGRYISTRTKDMIESGEEPDTPPRRMRATVLFSDIRGFTAYSEAAPPERVIHDLNEALRLQAEIIERHGGDIDKFVGDEVMAVFRSEFPAVSCALEITKRLSESNHLKAAGLQVGIGINTGDIVVGNIGSANRMEYASIGDTVNVASRLCALAESGAVVLSESTYAGVENKVRARKNEGLRIKGKKEPVTVYILEDITG